jgi:citrate lyase subunit beta/citryl-CoA lyase
MHLPPSKRLRRSELAVPGSSEKMMAKGAASAADFVFLDLEDAVAPSAKAEARGKVVTALNTLDWGKKTRCVRINDVETEYCYNDIIEVVEGARENLDVIMIPKVRHPRDLHFVETLLNQLELKLKLKKRIGLEVLIEEVEGLINVEQIARCSPRLEALILGMGDYSASQGMDQKEIWGSKDYPGDLWHYPRYKVVIAARAAGMRCVVTRSAYTQNETFSGSDAVFDAIGDVGEERFSLDDLTTPGSFWLNPPLPRDAEGNWAAGSAPVQAGGAGGVDPL